MKTIVLTDLVDAQAVNRIARIHHIDIAAVSAADDIPVDAVLITWPSFFALPSLQVNNAGDTHRSQDPNIDLDPRNDLAIILKAIVEAL